MSSFDRARGPMHLDEEEAKHRLAVLAHERRFFGERDADELVGIDVNASPPPTPHRLVFHALAFNKQLDYQRMRDLGVISENGMVAPEWEDALVSGSVSEALDAIRSGMLIPKVAHIRTILKRGNATILEKNVDVLRAIGAFEPMICDAETIDRLIDHAPLFFWNLAKEKTVFLDAGRLKSLAKRVLEHSGHDLDLFFRDLDRMGLMTLDLFTPKELKQFIQDKPTTAVLWLYRGRLRLTQDQARHLLVVLTPNPAMREVLFKVSDAAGFPYRSPLASDYGYIGYGYLYEIGVFEPGVMTPELAQRLIRERPDILLAAHEDGKVDLTSRQLEMIRDHERIEQEVFFTCVKILASRGISSHDSVQKRLGSRPDIAFLLVRRGMVTVSHEMFVDLLAANVGTMSPFFYELDDEELRKILLRHGQLANDDIAKIGEAILHYAKGWRGQIYQIEYLERLARLCGVGEQVCVFLRMCERVANSPSASLRKISPQIIDQLRTAADPLAVYEKVAAVFERNNLPLVGKVFKVFEAINTKEHLEDTLKNKALSPTLRAERYHARLFTVYKDLLSIHLDSNNPSLRAYLETFWFGEDVAAKLDQEGPVALTEEERGQFTTFVRRCERLFEQSLYGQRRPLVSGTEHEPSILETYQNLRRDLGVHPEQTLAERVASMYLKPLGLSTFDEALERMDRSRVRADERNRAWIEASGGRVQLQTGDLIKGCDETYFENILQNGSVAKECLGASADSDATPYDTDFGRVIASDVDTDLSRTLRASPAWAYGNLFLLVRDRGQFQETSAKDDSGELVHAALQRKTQTELFYSGAVDSIRKRHYGVRTGIASSEIDAIAVNENIQTKPKMLDHCVASIVAHGQYIPLVDVHGKVLLTPAQYDEYRRRFFRGIGGQPYVLERSPREESAAHLLRLDTVFQAKKREQPETQTMSRVLQEKILNTLSRVGVTAEVGSHELLTRAELYETGSTARGTNVPGSADFDFVVKLNANDKDRVGVIYEALENALGGTLHAGSGGDQLRLLGVYVEGKRIDVDIGFHSKAETDTYESYQSVRERLASIGRQYGEEALAQVVANIVLAKEILKEAEAYKTVEQGGLGGIGVENWILSEGGSVVVACESFEKAAYNGSSLRPFKEFKQRYKILNPAVNGKTGTHDSYLENMTEKGYQKMAGAVKGYLESLKES